MKITEKQYEDNELKLFLNEKNSHYESVSEFNEELKDQGLGWLAQQLDWVENGSYGAGAAIALRMAFESLNSRTNDVARIGGVFLHALYGKRGIGWHKLSSDVQDNLKQVILNWLKKEKEFAI